jgi:5-methylcytosine-specific restriction endonuclease McrA
METCPVCGKSFAAKPYRFKTLKRAETVTCSHECRIIHLGWGKRVLYCEWCGNEFRRDKSHVNDRNFCSSRCMGHWQSENIKGENSPSWKGGYKPYYGQDWSARRRQARERDGYCCRSCGLKEEDVTYTLEVHHIRPVRLFDNPNDANSLDNLITLCRPCHVKADVLVRRKE